MWVSAALAVGAGGLMGLGVHCDKCDNDIVCEMLVWLTGIPQYGHFISFCLQQLQPSLLTSACYLFLS